MSNAIKFVDHEGAGEVDVELLLIEPPPLPPEPLPAPGTSTAGAATGGGIPPAIITTALPAATSDTTLRMTSPISATAFREGALNAHSPRSSDGSSSSGGGRGGLAAPRAHVSRDGSVSRTSRASLSVRTPLAAATPASAAAAAAAASSADVAMRGGRQSSTTGTVSVSVDSAVVPPPPEPVQIMQWLRLSVRDNGVGISAEDMTFLWQPFHQISAGARQHGKGSGLGLSICKEIIRRHGGTVGVTSTVGVGSTFFADLPVVVCPPPPSEELSTRRGSEEMSSQSSSSSYVAGDDGMHTAGSSAQAAAVASLTTPAVTPGLTARAEAAQIPPEHRRGLIDHLVILVVDDGEKLVRARILIVFGRVRICMRVQSCAYAYLYKYKCVRVRTCSLLHIRIRMYTPGCKRIHLRMIRVHVHVPLTCYSHYAVPSNRMFLRRALNRLLPRCEVYEVSDGAQAVSLVECDMLKFHVLLMDNEMPVRGRVRLARSAVVYLNQVLHCS